ncbi:MAG: hypothetical protein ACKVJU_12820 [Verrucomicrobiales bacterium]
MKPKFDFETPFEDSLAEFEMASLPPEWKSELIENALSEVAESRISIFPSFTKIAVGLLAACWVLIGFLHVTTPTDSNFTGLEIAEKTELSPEDRTLIVAYFGGGMGTDINTTP